jgi:hypothetical protein
MPVVENSAVGEVRGCSVVERDARRSRSCAPECLLVERATGLCLGCRLPSGQQARTALASSHFPRVSGTSMLLCPRTGARRQGEYQVLQASRIVVTGNTIKCILSQET